MKTKEEAKQPVAAASQEVKTGNGSVGVNQTKDNPSASIATGQNTSSGAATSANSGQVKSKSASPAPKLTPAQKSQVNDKVSSVVNNIDSILNSIQEPKELDLSGM